MTRDQADVILDEIGMHLEMERYHDYSGRGMYGDTTEGIVVSSMTDFVAAIGKYISRADEGDLHNVNQLGSALQNLKCDSLGHDIIVY